MGAASTEHPLSSSRTKCHTPPFRFTIRGFYYDAWPPYFTPSILRIHPSSESKETTNSGIEPRKFTLVNQATIDLHKIYPCVSIPLGNQPYSTILYPSEKVRYSASAYKWCSTAPVIRTDTWLHSTGTQFCASTTPVLRQYYVSTTPVLRQYYASISQILVQYGEPVYWFEVSRELQYIKQIFLVLTLGEYTAWMWPIHRFWSIISLKHTERKSLLKKHGNFTCL